MHTLLLATQNPGKVREYQALLADLPVQVRSLADLGIDLDVDETGTTFAENAILKAQSYAALDAVTKLEQAWVWADDSGLEVDALGGAPGVHSARYAGPNATDEDRWRKLLADLSALPGDPATWTARFRCVVALVSPDGAAHTTQGTLEGRIIDQPRGSHGFGYDPIFLLPAEGKTLAELPSDHKNLISHRGQAAERAKALLTDLLKG